MTKKEIKIESVLDLNASNIWNTEGHDIAEMWNKDKQDEDFHSSEAKILNIIRLCYEVVHFNPDNTQDAARFDNGEWSVFSHVDPKKGSVAIRRREIKRLSDLTYENIHHISAALLLDLIDRNFGGGWDSIQLSMRDIIESGFDISTTTLPATRLHTAGGTYDRKVKDGFDVLEIPKGTWTEAIFAKKKDPVEKLHFQSESHYDEDGNLIVNPVDEDAPMNDDIDLDDEEGTEDETFYSSFSAEAAKASEEDEEELGGLNVE